MFTEIGGAEGMPKALEELCLKTEMEVMLCHVL